MTKVFISIALLVTNAAALLNLEVDLSEIRFVRKSVYCPTCEGGRLKVFATFHLVIESKNPAIGGEYFPISDLSGKVENVMTWREESFRSGMKFKQRIITPIPDKHKKDLSLGTYDLTIAFNGTNSWRYRPTDHMAEELQGLTTATQAVEDYTGDLLGVTLPVKKKAMSRTVPTPLEEPYDLDAVLSSNLYSLVGNETVEGENCTVIQREGLDRIWLSIPKNYVVVKREWRWNIGGPMKRRIFNRDFRQIANGVWLPFSSSMEVFSLPGTGEKRVAILKSEVTSASNAFPDSEFEPDFKKGTVINVVATREKRVFGSTAEEVANRDALAILKKIQAKPAETAFAFKKKPWLQRYLVEILGVCSLFITIIAIYLLRRKTIRS